jgi:hypothetical protein
MSTGYAGRPPWERGPAARDVGRPPGEPGPAGPGRERARPGRGPAAPGRETGLTPVLSARMPTLGAFARVATRLPATCSSRERYGAIRRGLDPVS